MGKTGTWVVASQHSARTAARLDAQPVPVFRIRTLNLNVNRPKLMMKIGAIRIGIAAAELGQV